MNKHVLCAVSLLLAVGCSDGFDKSSVVNKLRILAVHADTPYALPGQRVKLDALAYDPAQRSIEWGWGTCESAASSNAVDCLHALSFAQLDIGADMSSFALTVPPSLAQYVGVVVLACPGHIQAGTTSTLPIACIDDGGAALPLSEFELGVKRIFLRASELNHNPEIQDVSIEEPRCKTMKDGACDEFEQQRIEVRAEGAAEQTVDSDGNPIREGAVVQFYATGGDFEDEVRLADEANTKWHPRREDAGRTIQFWFVVRDDRGGVSWTQRTLQVP